MEISILISCKQQSNLALAVNVLEYVDHIVAFLCLTVGLSVRLVPHSISDSIKAFECVVHCGPEP